MIDAQERTESEKEEQITILLGYLTEKQWADAINNNGVDKDLAFSLIKKQEDAYGGNLLEEVQERL